MARKSARQIAASRKNIRKAQLASARKRRGSGGSKKWSRKKKIAVGAALGVGVAYSAHKTRHRVRDSALKKRHGENYVARKTTYHHYTNNNAARRIAKTRTFKPTGKHGGHGKSHGVWLTTGKHDGKTRDVFGKARVSVKLSRKQVLKHETHRIPGGLDKKTRGVTHIQVDKKLLNGKKIKSNLPKTAGGTRARVKAGLRENRHLKGSSRRYQATRDVAVSRKRRAAKRVIKRFVK